jgi:6-phosphogluconolactonase
LSHPTYRGYIGTYTKGESKGIYTFELDAKPEKILNVKPVSELDNPTYVTISKDNRYLYSVIKKGEWGGAAAFSINSDTGELEQLNEKLAPGSAPCHISVSQDNHFVVTANYHKGTVESYGTQTDGALKPVISVIEHHGSGPNEARQEKPHVHFAGFTPDEKYVVAVDLGIDKIMTYALNNGELTEVNHLSLKPGSGPRHLVFHPNGRIAYIMTELSSEVIVLDYDAVEGVFSIKQTISTLPANFSEHNDGSAIHISSDGRFIYAGNRGHNSIAVFSVDQESGGLTFVEHTATEGKWPRDFMLDPSEQFLVVSNQHTGNLVLFSRDVNTGKLQLLQSDVKVPDPVCVKFLNV